MELSVDMSKTVLFEVGKLGDDIPVYKTFAIPPVAMVIVNQVQVKCLILSRILMWVLSCSSPAPWGSSGS